MDRFVEAGEASRGGRSGTSAAAAGRGGIYPAQRPFQGYGVRPQTLRGFPDSATALDESLALTSAEGVDAPRALEASAIGTGGTVDSNRWSDSGRGQSVGFDFRRIADRGVRPSRTDGSFVDRYADGAIAIEGQYQNDERTGEWSAWHADGTLSLEGEYADGKRVGRWRAYHPNGQLLSEGQYQAGEREGMWETRYSNGLVKERGLFVGGLRSSVWEFYDRFGQSEPRSGTYRFGRRIH